MDKKEMSQSSIVQKRCDKCVGTGFLKYDVKYCETCKGIKCVMCNSMGYDKMPWDLCDNCCGDGYFIVNRTNNP